MRMLIAFVPEKEIISRLDKARKLAKIKIKKGSGLKTPHITIVDNSFSNIEEVDKTLEKIARSTKPFSARIISFDTFEIKQSLKIEK